MPVSHGLYGQVRKVSADAGAQNEGPAWDPSSFQSAALPTELPGQTGPLNNVAGSGTLCRKLCRSICADGGTWCSSVRKHAKKTAARHSGAVLGDPWPTLRCGDPRSTLWVADRSSTPPLTSAACAVTVSVTVSGPTFRWSAARLAATPLRFSPPLHCLR